MTRFQKLSLLIGALVLVLLVALLAVTVLKPTTVLNPTSALSSGDQTNTWVVEFSATNAATIEAMQTGAWQTLEALTPQSP